MRDVAGIRKTLIWGIPLYLGVAIGSILMVAYIMVPTIEGIAERAPVVRIGPAVLVAPFVAAFCLLGVVVASMRAIPCSDRIIKPFERAFIATVFAGVVAMLLIPVTAALARSRMPSIGYTQCHVLQGQPTLWFTDWVRDPAWCVRGKSLDWVNEQARLSVARPIP
ncbi:hypothetical protein M5C97_07330 [Acidovorax sp. NCPPB 3859]|nr:MULTISPECIES: hypothetical protein [unclassified Acidovorax]MDA8452474.1 hypothetical protein [Acidovorax sp. GBBC 3297]MDA8461910.1 hypothetical protein [Acidovorax sp. GBBC 3333]MDA8466915.1 hypothetical protein [Acidovorax sp. GBBC 3332]MDA8471979.1 hypothetical protein [Acidovorax sp. GBBC 3299]WCM80102.1 hypothetical protein M5C94_07325 [Acidovorax sp. GBBC 712]